MSAIKSYRDLLIWQRGMDLAKQVYTVSRLLPKQEMFGLCSQIQRAAVSVPSNIAEGHAKSKNHFLNHLSIAMGSIAELETQLLLSACLYPHTKEAIDPLLAGLDQLGRMIRALMQRLE